MLHDHNVISRGTSSLFTGTPINEHNFDEPCKLRHIKSYERKPSPIAVTPNCATPVDRKNTLSLFYLIEGCLNI